MAAGDSNKRQIALIMGHLFPGSWQAEFRFHPVRRWRFDFAAPAVRLAVEYHGHSGMLGRSKSGHSTISGLTSDCEKLNHAQLLGWRWIALTAMHFSARDRARHKLATPMEILTAAAKLPPIPI